MQRISALLDKTAKLSALARQADSLAASQKIWSTIVPEPLRPMTRAGAINHRRLTVYAENGAVAAKIKLLLPSLLTKLQKQEVEVTSIRVVVQVKYYRQKPEQSLRTISPEAAQRLQAFADQLGDSALGEVLARLASRTQAPLD